MDILPDLGQESIQRLLPKIGDQEKFKKQLRALNKNNKSETIVVSTARELFLMEVVSIFISSEI